MKTIYRAVAEVTRKPDSDYFMFGFGQRNVDDTSWVGSIYVSAADSEEAMGKFVEFFRQNAIGWSFEGELEQVSSLNEFEMDFDVIKARGELSELEEKGMVVAGWGM